MKKLIVIVTFLLVLSASAAYARSLRKGAHGEDVRQWQWFLSMQGFDAGAADGSFGPRTASQTKAFQKKYGLYQDGIVGPRTLRKAQQLNFRLISNNRRVTSDIKRAIATFLIEVQEDPNPRRNNPFKVAVADVQGSWAFVVVAHPPYRMADRGHLIVWKPRSAEYGDIRKRNGGWYAREPKDIPGDEIPGRLQQRWGLKLYWDQ